jgi:putative ABC transport system permease protein
MRPAGNGTWREIVGVVPDLALNPDAPSSADGIYVPLPPTNVVVLGTRTPQPERVERDLHEAALALELRPQVQWTITVREQMNTAEAIFRGLGSVMFAAGGAALLLACAGVYAMVAFELTQRRKEIAIRIAIGAGRRDIARAILGRTLTQMSIGVAAGSGLTAIVYRLIGTLPITVETSDPCCAVAVTLALATTALAACARPLAAALGTRPTDWLRDG